MLPHSWEQNGQTWSGVPWVHPPGTDLGEHEASAGAVEMNAGGHCGRKQPLAGLEDGDALGAAAEDPEQQAGEWAPVCRRRESLGA